MIAQKECPLYSQKHGALFGDEDREALALMSDSDVVIRARYIRTGLGTFHTPEGLERTGKSLRDSVSKLLRESGVIVRL
jgi:hypothetical protein